MRVPIGRVDDLPDDACVSVADGRVVVVRLGDEVRAYRNRCLHQDSPLAGGWVRDGVLSCPLHFWRYDVATGELRNGDGCLERYPVEYHGGMANVILPDAEPPRSLRDELLERARTYDRDVAFRARGRD